MTKRRVAILILILLTSLLTCAALFQVIIYGCLLWDCAPKRSFKVLDLDLPDNLYPQGSIVNSLYPLSEGEGTTENGSKTVYWNGGWGRAIYIIWRYPSARQAAKMFPLEKKGFADTGSKKPWQRPSTLTFVSRKADDFFLGCGYWSEYHCGMVARYAEYIVHFNAIIDSEMAHDDFQKIVVFIDNQISAKLRP
jgi:hypothetical protein